MGKHQSLAALILGASLLTCSPSKEYVLIQGTEGGEKKIESFYWPAQKDIDAVVASSFSLSFMQVNGETVLGHSDGIYNTLCFKRKGEKECDVLIKYFPEVEGRKESTTMVPRIEHVRVRLGTQKDCCDYYLFTRNPSNGKYDVVHAKKEEPIGRGI